MNKVNEISPNFELLRRLSEASDRELDAQMCEKLKQLLDQDTSTVTDGLLYILDMSARYSLASGFVMRILDHEWRRLGGKIEPDFSNCPWRKEK